MNDAVLNYRVEGSGPHLLLVHGFGISFNIWSELLPLLASQFSVVMIELPGIGASATPLEGTGYLQSCIQGIQLVRRQLMIDQWAVLGYSTGSRIAEAYIRSDAAHVSRAVFLCPLLIDRHKERALQFGLRLDRRIPAFGDWILSGWRLRFLISWLGFNLQPDARSHAWFREISSAPLGILKETIRAAGAVATSPLSVPVPLAMIWGDHDLVPMKPRQPGRDDFFVHGSHAAPVESAGEIASAIASWLRGSQPLSGKQQPG